MTEQKRPTYLYFFAHMYLEDLVMKYPEFFSSVVNKGANVFESTLKESFNKVLSVYDLSEKEIKFADDDFTTSVSKLTNDLSLLLIKFPQPKNTTEVSYVGIILGPKPRYFTLEAHYMDENEKQINPEGKDNFCVCEWSREGKHTLYMNIEEDRPGLFAAKVQEIINRN